MVARRMRIGMLFACAGLASAAGFSPAFGGWSHHVAPGVASSGVQVSNSSATSILSGSYKYFSETGTAIATATSTGSGATASIVVQVDLYFSGVIYSSQTFNFASLSSPSQSGSLAGTHGYSLVATATPSSASNQVGIAYSIQGPTKASSVGVVATLPSATVDVTSGATTAATTTTSTSGVSSNSSNVAGATSSSAAAISPVAASTDAAAVAKAVAEVREASLDAQAAIQACNTNTGFCVSAAFDAYADKLDAIAPNLPPSLRALPTIVREAAGKVRAAKTKREAETAVKSAIVQVNQTIALLKADDPNSSATGVSVGRAIDRTLEVAEVKLLRTSGL